MSDEKSDRGFKSVIDEEVARFEAEQRQKEEDEAAAEEQLQVALRKGKECP